MGIGHKIGWLSPNGDLYECARYAHIEMAFQIADELNYVVQLSADETLLSKGWVHISISLHPQEWHIVWDRFLSETQKQFLRPYFEESNLPVSFASQMLWDMEGSN